MSYSLEIKNLSFAMEALSRIVEAKDLYEEVKRLLEDALAKQRDFNYKVNQPVSTRRPAPIDDDIPY